MLRKALSAVRPSNVAGAAIFSALYVANRLTVTDDPRLKAYKELPKPLAIKQPSPAAVAPAEEARDSPPRCSPIYNGYDGRSPRGSIPMPHPLNTTLVKTLKASCEAFADRNAMGVRPLSRIEKRVRMTDGEEKVWDVYQFEPARYYTYRQLWEMVECFGRGMMEIGLLPDARVALCEETRMEWFVACYGIWYAGATGCTVYANMNANALEHALGQMRATHVLCNGSNLTNFIQYCQSRQRKGEAIPTIVYTDSLPEGFAVPSGFAMLAFDEVVAMGRSSSKVPLEPHTPDETALIMYTSGTTGKPKGVMVSHHNILSTINTIGHCLDHMFGDRSDVTYLAYLPLAHILEFVCENTLLHRGMLVAYGSPRTLTDNASEPHGDLAEFRPHFMCGVPRVFDSIRKTVYEKLKSPVTRFVFEAVYADKVRWMQRGKDTPFYNSFVFKAVTDNLGGRVEACLSGGAPLSRKVQQFMQVCVTPAMIQGYGLTETCACTAIQYPGDLTKESVGMILRGVDLKLRDTEHWKHTDTPEPRGEILVRGPMVTKGYFQNPTKTAESFSPDGWFATGDVGSITEDGNLRIVGRVESLIKNANGEYIAVEALEAVYALHPLASPNSVCVLVDQHKDYITAIVLTDMAKTMAWAQTHGFANAEWPAILKDEAFLKEATASMRRTGVKGRLKPFELVKRVVVLADEWTPQNGCLTAAMKIKREVLLDRYKPIVADLFKDNSI